MFGIDISSWQGLFATVLSLAVVTFVGVGGRDERGAGGGRGMGAGLGLSVDEVQRP